MKTKARVKYAVISAALVFCAPSAFFAQDLQNPVSYDSLNPVEVQLPQEEQLPENVQIPEEVQISVEIPASSSISTTASTSAPVSISTQTPAVKNLHNYTANGVNFETVELPSGSFSMGGEEKPEHMPVHDSKVKAFEIARTETTQELFKAVTGKNSSSNRGDTLPVENVSWYDAIVFCNQLSLLLGYTPCYSVNGMTNPSYWNYSVTSGNIIQGTISCNYSADGFRLPTEAEWEYACRGGSSGISSNYIYSGSNNLDEVAVNRTFTDQTLDVALMQSNQLGIYDMSGNVYEWCWDWYGYYSDNKDEDYAGPVKGTVKVLRGGSYSSEEANCMCESRYSLKPGVRHNDVGFRIVRHILTEEEKREIARNQKAKLEAEEKALRDNSYNALSARRKLFGATYNMFTSMKPLEETPDFTFGYMVNGFLYSPLTNNIFWGLDGGYGLNTSTGYYDVKAMARIGFNSPLWAERMVRLSGFVEAGIINFELGAGIGTELELFSLFTKTNFGIGIILSMDATVSQSLKVECSGGLGLEILLPNIRKITESK